MTQNSKEMIYEFIGCSLEERVRMARALRVGRRVKWTKTPDCQPNDVAQLSPISWSVESPISMDSSVTVVIPSHRPTVPHVDAFVDQPGVEKTIVLSNGDGLREHSRAQVVHTPWLGHGGTRQLALEFVDTEYVFFTVDDALPMQALFPPLIEALSNFDVDVACPRQIPWPDSDPFTRFRLAGYMPGSDQPYQISYADHVGALYRTEDMRKWTLRPAPIAEDMWWTKGRHVLCVPNSNIMHAHLRKPTDLYLRERAIGLERLKMSMGVENLSRFEVLVSSLSATWRYGIREGVCALAENLGRRHGAMGK